MISFQKSLLFLSLPRLRQWQCMVQENILGSVTYTYIDRNKKSICIYDQSSKRKDRRYYEGWVREITLDICLYVMSISPATVPVYFSTNYSRI